MFPNSIPIHTVYERDSEKTNLLFQFTFNVFQSCEIKGTEYTVTGNYWIPVDGNPGKISLIFQQLLKVNIS